VASTSLGSQRQPLPSAGAWASVLSLAAHAVAPLPAVEPRLLQLDIRVLERQPPAPDRKQVLHSWACFLDVAPIKQTFLDLPLSTATCNLAPVGEHTLSHPAMYMATSSLQCCHDVPHLHPQRCGRRHLIACDDHVGASAFVRVGLQPPHHARNRCARPAACLRASVPHRRHR
jgi:hypothetical protein